MVCLGFKPGGVRMEGAEESTELRRHPMVRHYLGYLIFHKFRFSVNSKQFFLLNVLKYDFNILLFLLISLIFIDFIDIIFLSLTEKAY